MFIQGQLLYLRWIDCSTTEQPNYQRKTNGLLKITEICLMVTMISPVAATTAVLHRIVQYQTTETFRLVVARVIMRQEEEAREQACLTTTNREIRNTTIPLAIVTKLDFCRKLERSERRILSQGKSAFLSTRIQYNIELDNFFLKILVQNRFHTIGHDLQIIQGTRGERFLTR